MYKLKKGEVAIVLKPVLDDEGDWSGKISTGIAFAHNEDQESMHAAMDLALTLICIPPYMDSYPELEEELIDYKHAALSELFPEAYKEVSERVDKEQEYTKKGNVITLNAWRKTEGNA